MAALRPRNRNAGQTDKPAVRRSRNARAVGDNVEALRRRVEELELENAVMREVGGGRKKKTQALTCGACRTGRRRFQSTV